MPELAKPWLSPGTILKEQRSSKSPTVPLVQMRNVFPLAGFSTVVWPVMAPSLTDQSLGLPSQPERFLPLNRLRKPFSAGRSSRSVVGCRGSRRASAAWAAGRREVCEDRSEEHTSELQSHSFISYAVFCLKKN